MFSYTGKTALITGASSGIGESFARALAAQCSTLILVARSEDKMHQIGESLQQAHGVRVEVIPADLSEEHAVDGVMTELERRGLKVDILINNAGYATYGYFDQLDFERQHREVMLNVLAVVDLTHRLLPGMVARGNGGIINVASTAAIQPVPYMAVYGATKAFVLSFSEALWAENRARGIHVLALCPDATETDFFNVVGSRDVIAGGVDTPETVVSVGLKALARGDNFAILGGGRRNSLLVRLLPRRAILQTVARMYKPKADTQPA